MLLNKGSIMLWIYPSLNVKRIYIQLFVCLFLFLPLSNQCLISFYLLFLSSLGGLFVLLSEFTQ